MEGEIEQEEKRVEEKRVEEKAEEGAGEVRTPVPPVMEEEEFQPLIDIYMAKRGLKDRTQAAIGLYRLFKSFGFDPQADLREALSQAGLVLSALGQLGGGPITEGAVDAAKSTIAVKMAEQIIGEARDVSVEDRVAKMVEKITPAMMQLKIIDHVMRSMFPEEEGKKRSDVDELKRWVEEQFDSLRQEMQREKEEKKWEERLEAIEKKFTERLESLAKPKGEEGGLAKDIRDIKETLARKEEEKEESKIVQEIRALASKLETARSPEERKDVLQEFVDRVSSTTDSMVRLKDSLIKLGLVKEEEVTTKEGKIDVGKLANRIIGVIEKAVERFPIGTPPQRQVAVIPEKPLENKGQPISGEQIGAQPGPEGAQAPAGQPEKGEVVGEGAGVPAEPAGSGEGGKG
jgi:hypothetical protein